MDSCKERIKVEDMLFNHLLYWVKDILFGSFMDMDKEKFISDFYFNGIKK